jgi:hypothetical protein
MISIQMMLIILRFPNFYRRFIQNGRLIMLNQVLLGVFKIYTSKKRKHIFVKIDILLIDVQII